MIITCKLYTFNRELEWVRNLAPEFMDSLVVWHYPHPPKESTWIVDFRVLGEVPGFADPARLLLPSPILCT